MSWKDFWGRLLSGVVGVVIGSFVGQYFAVTNLAGSYKFQQNQEILRSTRLGIGFLMQVQNEMDENAALLLNGDYDITLKTSAPKGMFDGMLQMVANAPEMKTNQEAYAAVTNIFGPFNLPVCHVDRLNIPSLNLSDAVWKHGAPELADIDYDLLRKLSDYYMLVQRVNSLIDGFNRIGVEPGGQVSPEMATKLGNMAFDYADNIKKVKGKDNVELKDEVSKEIQRLSVIRTKVVGQSE